MLTVAILEAQNKRLREENEELRETIRQLRETAAHTVVELPAGIPHLTPLEEKTMRALLARPALASKEYLYRAMYPNTDEVDVKIIDVMVYHLRRKVPRDVVVIKTLWARGFQTELVKKPLMVPVRSSPHQSETIAA